MLEGCAKVDAGGVAGESDAVARLQVGDGGICHGGAVAGEDDGAAGAQRVAGGICRGAGVVVAHRGVHVASG